jgi:hypothetical protein
MTDDTFVTAIETCTLPKEEFTHRNHVRLAWLYLRAYPPADADRRIANTIRAYATSVGATTKFNESLTLDWMRRVEAAMLETPAEEFETFLAARPDLLSSKR